jgi:hypothetical protein
VAHFYGVEVLKTLALCPYGTHVLPAPLPAPPGDWAEPFKAEATNLELTITDISSAHNALEKYLRALGEQRSPPM